MTPTQQQAADLAAQLRTNDLRTGAEAPRLGWGIKMQIKKVEDGYQLRKPGGGFIHLVRNYNGVESWACEAIDLLCELREENARLRDTINSRADA